MDVPDVPSDIPGELDWFKPGTDAYNEWRDQRESFLETIKPSTSGGRAILNDLLDGLLRGEIPTGWSGVLSMTFRLTAQARRTCKRRRLWEGLVWEVLQRTFTPPIARGEEFVLSFSQIQQLWVDADGNDLAWKDYKRLYSVIKTKLEGGPLRDVLLQYPRLDEYAGMKLSKFTQSYLHFRSLVD